MLNPEKRKACADAGREVPQDSEAARQRQVAYWSNPENRRKHSELKRKHHRDPRVGFRKLEGFRRSTFSRDGSGLTVGERKVRDRLLAEGWSIVRGGEPDFWAVHPDGRRMCVEVKSPKDHLRPEQNRMHEFLRREFGLETLVIVESNVDEEAA